MFFYGKADVLLAHRLGGVSLLLPNAMLYLSLLVMKES